MGLFNYIYRELVKIFLSDKKKLGFLYNEIFYNLFLQRY